MTGLLLAGGRSVRMGVDKATLEFEGEPLARRVARVLDRTCDSVLVASGDGQRLAWLGLPQIPDVLADAGPLAGLVAGLEAATAPHVAVLAVDMPHASEGVLRLLSERVGAHEAAIPQTDDGLHPLHAVYARTAASRVRAAFQAGERSVQVALRSMDVLVVGPDDWRAADPSGHFAWNLNRPEDLPANRPASS